MINSDTVIHPLSTAPTDGTYILLFGSSRYTNTPLRCCVAKYAGKYDTTHPWRTYSNNSFMDDGDHPIGWLPLPVYKPIEKYLVTMYESGGAYRRIITVQVYASNEDEAKQCALWSECMDITTAKWTEDGVSDVGGEYCVRSLTIVDAFEPIIPTFSYDPMEVNKIR